MLYMNLTNFANAAAETTAAAAETTAAIAETTVEFVIDPMNFVVNLKYMGLGMLGIFLVMCAIILSTYLLNKLFSRKTDLDGE